MPSNSLLPLEQIQIRATNFSKKWESYGREKSYGQIFVVEFLDIFGQIEIGTTNGIFEYPLRMKDGTDGSIDFYWKNRVAIEMKSTGKNLGDAFRQLTDYMDGLSVDETPNLWIVCDFQRFHVYRKDTHQSLHFELKKLRKYIKHLVELAGYKTPPVWELAHTWLIPPYEPEAIHPEKPDVDFHATAKMVKLYEALQSINYQPKHLEIFLTRLLFCFFADDTDIFPQDSFYHYISDNNRNHSDLSSRLASLFDDLDLPNNDRVVRTFTTDKVQQSDFSYINGSVFRDRLPIAPFDKKMYDTLLECANFDWSKINPAIFGTLFQGIMGKTERREKGAHYTSEENILKLIKPLFMDGLREEFAKICTKPNELASFHDKIANLKFLDPACGCGNFLIIAYRELRRLEHDVLRELRRFDKGNGHRLLNIETHFKVTVEQFHGIELESWPCQIARTGMWLMDHLMNMEATEEFGQHFTRIPLTKGAEIVNANALRVDWADIVPNNELSYILGNPPFGGARTMRAAQKEDIEQVFGDMKGLGNLDYVTAWYRKAADEMEGNKKIRTAFVSTNSITQGDQVAILWKPLMEGGIFINFGVPTFKWSNEANGKAAVHCVIVGFSHQRTEPNINPYLIQAPTVFIESRKKPLCGAPEMGIGNKPIDGGNYLFTEEEKKEFLKAEPEAKKWFRPWVGSDEFINGYVRHCLWLGDCPPSELRSMPETMKRVEAVRKLRLASKSEPTRRLAAIPRRFHVENMPKHNYMVIPETSSERRLYIPMGFLKASVLCSNAIRIIPSATNYHFGILTSSVHMAWVRVVCGRLKSDFRYSKDIVYNNFPWPEATDKQKSKIEELAQGVLDARKLYRESSLADLYDPLAMPKELLKAHQALDRAVMKLYGFDKDVTESAIVAGLMNMYKEMAVDG